jgi:hypothetical protein
VREQVSANLSTESTPARLNKGSDINVVLKVLDEDFYKKLKYAEFKQGFDEVCGRVSQRSSNSP